MTKRRVLIAGIAGASLGTELLKCLSLASCYLVYGCDISPYAFGHYATGFEGTFVVDAENYVDSVLALCRKEGLEAVVAGAEQPAVLLAAATEPFAAAGVLLAGNSSSVVETCSNKQLTFARLAELGMPIPATVLVRSPDDLSGAVFPCVLKPATGSGGSSLVFLASNAREAELYASCLWASGRAAIAQEYVPLEAGGEFTIGVLSLPDGSVAGSVAMQRMFHAKLSVATRTPYGLISSGYSQGLIDEFPELRVQAERIARELGSTGPLNVQGRVRDGVLLPFEVNPRFSASTYLRALAGFNEIDAYLRFCTEGVRPRPPELRRGYYFRSLSEVYVPAERLGI